MESYSSFAKVYDTFMDNVPYEEGYEYLSGILKKYDIRDGLVAELGCGTGTLTELFAKNGYDMIGIDNSSDMLEIAMEKKNENQSQSLYLLQDMREFELYGTVRAVISFCDSINYILEPEELTEVFKLVNNYLDPNGIFIFDFHTLFYYQEELGEQTFAEDRDDMSFIWDNYFDEETRINEYRLSIFVEEEPDLFRRYQEDHFQRAYSLDEIKQCLEDAGLTFLGCFDELSDNEPTAESSRIHVVAREHGKLID